MTIVFEFLKVYHWVYNEHGHKVARLYYRANFVSRDEIKSLRQKYKQELGKMYAGSVARRKYE
jgi:hypothetical protein